MRKALGAIPKWLSAIASVVLAGVAVLSYIAGTHHLVTKVTDGAKDKPAPKSKAAPKNPGPTVQNRPTEPCAQRSRGSRATGYEPNDSPGTAFGPLTGGATYSGGKIETDNDNDYFVFCVSMRAQLTISMELTGCKNYAGNPSDCSNVHATLTDPANNEVGSTSRQSVGGGDPITYTVSGAGRYILRFDGDQSNTYQFRVDASPASALSGSLSH
jgi:hypothetical protein